MRYCKNPQVEEPTQASGEACNVVSWIQMPDLCEEGLFLVISFLRLNAFFEI